MSEKMHTNKASSYQVHTIGIAFGMAKRQCQENVIPSHSLPPLLAQLTYVLKVVLMHMQYKHR